MRHDTARAAPVGATLDLLPLEATMYSESTHRPIDEDTPCPLCGEVGHVPAATAGGSGALPLRCPNGHTITLVRLEAIPEPPRIPR